MSGKRILLLAVFVIVCFASPAASNFLDTSETPYKQTWAAFQGFMQEHNRTYEGMDELSYRYSVFHQNYLYIQQENQKGYDYWLDINQFADLTKEEFAKYYLTLKGQSSDEVEIVEDDIVDVPESIDWSSKGHVTGVKDQGRCGSCWAFSSTGGLEHAYKAKHGTLKSFSEQQLVDCDKKDWGCDGGLQEYAYNYLKTHLAELESDYKYTGRDGTCKYNSAKGVVKVQRYQSPGKNEAALKKSVAVRATPVSVDAGAFQFYKGGILNANCGKQLDHAVLAVGYGTDNGKKFWKVKNSWGRSWGESGYIRLKRTDSSTSSGQCGVAMDPVYPVI